VKIAARLGYLKNGDDVVSHAWLSGIDWDALANRTCEPPWRPKLKGADDTSYFDLEAAEESAEASSRGREMTAEIPPEVVEKYAAVFESFAA